jgi:hypothetical protein
MKQLYTIDTITSNLYLNNGRSKIVNRELSILGRYSYQYGEVPDDKIIEYSDWDSMLKGIGYINEFKGLVTKFKKRIYINERHYNLGKIYKDEFQKLVIETKYKIIKANRYPSIEMLERDLGFMKYSELVFDRENELKKMMLNK